RTSAPEATAANLRPAKQFFFQVAITRCLAPVVVDDLDLCPGAGIAEHPNPTTQLNPYRPSSIGSGPARRTRVRYVSHDNSKVFSPPSEIGHRDPLRERTTPHCH